MVGWPVRRLLGGVFVGIFLIKYRRTDVGVCAGEAQAFSLSEVTTEDARDALVDDCHTLILILSILLMQELISIFTPSSLSLVNSGTLFLVLFPPLSYNLTSFKRGVSRHLLN